MKKILRFLAVFVLLASLGVWWVCGANSGWTKNSVEVRTVDEVTGIEGIRYEMKWMPGVDFLAGSLAAAGVLAGVSFLFRTKPAQPNQTDKPNQQLT